jgi:hypothetical protein
MDKLGSGLEPVEGVVQLKETSSGILSRFYSMLEA